MTEDIELRAVREKLAAVLTEVENLKEELRQVTEKLLILEILRDNVAEGKVICGDCSSILVRWP